MRLLAHIAAFAILLCIGYLLIAKGYPHFLRQTHNEVAAQIMTLICLAGTTVALIWATRRIP